MSLSSTDIKEVRRFGLIAIIFFGILFSIGLWRDKPVPIFLFGFLSFLGICFFLMPSMMRPVFERWMKIAECIGKVVTAIILTLCYYLVITPFGLLKRIFGGRPLPLFPDYNKESYWVEREEPAQPKERFYKRF